MKMLFAIALSVILIMTTTTTISNVNAAAAQQQWLNAKASGITVPESGQLVQVSFWDAVKSAVKRLSGYSPVQNSIQDARKIMSNATQETRSMCATVNNAIPGVSNVCTIVNKEQGFAQGTNQQPSNFPQQAQQQQLNPNVRDHRTDTVESGRELPLLPSTQPPTPQLAVAPPTPNQQRLQIIFKSIKIINDHDPNIIGQNDGEWKIGALVNGQFRDLSPPGSPLGDARGGSTYSLTNMQPVVLNVDKTSGALVISTVGQELDGCGFSFSIPPAVTAAGTALSGLATGDAAAAGTTILYYATQLKSVQSVINR